MKEKPDSQSRWDELVAKARLDVGPSVDREALRQALRAASPVEPRTWAEEFSARFASGRVLSGCLAGACAFALVATWQAWELSEDLPWVEWVTHASGGAP